MRNKRISFLMALMFLISAVAFPMTAFAAGDKDTTPPELTASLDGGILKVESSDDGSGVEAVFVDGNRINSLTDGAATVTLKDYAGTEKQVSVYAQDHAGNRSEAVKFDNPYYEEPEETSKPSTAAQGQESAGAAKPTQAASSGSTDTAATQNGNSGSGSGRGANGGSSSVSGNSGSGTAGQSSTASDSSSSESREDTTSSIPEGAFTPEGTGTVLDTATGEDGDKQFYTITTEAGNVFYLIIDGKRDSRNVYFLNSVTEDDLMALAEKSDSSVSAIPAEETCTCTDRCGAGEVDTGCPVCKNDMKSCIGKEKPDETSETEEPAETEKPKKDSSAGTVIFIIAALLAVGGAGYYVKIVRPKQQAEADGFDDEDDGYGEGFDPDEAFGETEYLSEDDFEDRMDDEHEDGE